MVAIAPALTIGFIGRPSLSSIAITELNGRPVLLTPRASRAAAGPTASHTNAKTKGLEMLWIENVWSVSPTAPTRPVTLTMQMPNQSAEASARIGM